MSLPPPPFSLSLLGAAPPPPPDGAANSWSSLPYRRELFFPCDVEAWRGSSLSRDVGRSPAGLMSSSARGMKVCYRCGLELISLSQGRPVYSLFLCERQSGSKSISLSLSISFSLSLSLSPSQGIPVLGAVSLLPIIQLFIGQGISSPVASQKVTNWQPRD